MLAPGEQNTLATTPLRVDVAPTLSRLASVRAVGSYRAGFLEYGPRRVWVLAPPDVSPHAIPPSQLLSGATSQVQRRLRTGGWAVLSAALADERGLSIGQRFTLPSPQPIELRLAGTSTNLGWPPGAIVMNGAPSYEAVRTPLLDYARCLQVLALNHEPDAPRRQRRLRQWAARERPQRRGERWHELAGEATGSLAIHGLLALAARERVHEAEIERALAVYPRLAALATMLDSYVDRKRDAEHASHSYLAHYAPGETIERLAALIGECLAAAPTLPGGERNKVLVASMVAMYLSGDGARDSTRPATRALTRAGGALTGLLVPVLRAWRVAYGLQRA